MNGRPPLSFAFPKPGRALLAVLVAMTAVGIFTAFLGAWVPGGPEAAKWFAFEPARPWSMPWRWIVSGLLTSPAGWSHLLFSLVGLYFLGAPLERRWGAWRFARFLAISVVLGNAVTLGIHRMMPPDAPERFHPEFVFGPTAAITAIAIAWAREFSESTVQLFMVIPVRAKVLFWITIGFCVLDLIYPAGMPEGVVAPFGGLVAGLLFGGSPSPTRALWLRARLALLRRRSGGSAAQDILSLKAGRRPRAGAPPLRIVPGGLDEVLKKRTPPKDKRYLN
jgi:membrane associated rhomboid family serine protease